MLRDSSKPIIELPESLLGSQGSQGHKLGGIARQKNLKKYNPKQEKFEKTFFLTKPKQLLTSQRNQEIKKSQPEEEK